MMSAVLSNPSHPEYGVATIPFPIPRNQYTHCMPDTVCSSPTRMERTDSLLTRKATTTPDTVLLSPTPAVC